MRPAPGAPAASRADHYAQRRQVLRRIATEEDAYGSLTAAKAVRQSERRPLASWRS